MSELHTTLGKGVEYTKQTGSVINNNISAPRTDISKAGSTGTVTTTGAAAWVTTITMSKTWKQVPEVGDEIFCYGFSTAGNNGRFTVTAATSNTVVFVNSSAAAEGPTAFASQGNISIYHTPEKGYTDVAFTSGVPNCTTIAAGASGTLSAVAGVYSYMSASNGTNVNLDIVVAGGKLRVPAGSSIGHEIRPFTSDISCDASSAASGEIILNIS